MQLTLNDHQVLPAAKLGVLLAEGQDPVREQTGRGARETAAKEEERVALRQLVTLIKRRNQVERACTHERGIRLLMTSCLPGI